MTLPDFLVIGAGRAGTTSIYRYLQQHPQVFMSPIKETNFFAYTCADWDDRELKRLGWSGRFPVRSLDAYEALFERVLDEKAVGEVSPRYLSDGRRAAECIRRCLPGVRLIAILRNPISLAFRAKRMLPERFQHELNGLLEFMPTRRLEKREMRAETRIWLADHYRADIEKLEKLIGRDLAAWIA